LKSQDGGGRRLVFEKEVILATLSTTGCHSALADNGVEMSL